MDFGTLWDRFVADGLLTPAERDAARARQQRRGGTPDTAILEVRPLTGAERRRLVVVTAEVAGLGVAHPGAIEEADPALLERLPAALRRHHALLPTRLLPDDGLEVITALNPAYVLSEIARLIGCRIEARLALEVEVRAALAERMGLVLPPRFIPLVEVLRRADARERHLAEGAASARATPTARVSPTTLAMSFGEELARALDSLDSPQPPRPLATAPLPGAALLAEAQARNTNLQAARFEAAGTGPGVDPSRMKTPVQDLPGMLANGELAVPWPTAARPGPVSAAPASPAGGIEPGPAAADGGLAEREEARASGAERSRDSAPLFAVRSPNRAAQTATPAPASSSSTVLRGREGSHRIEAPFGLPPIAARAGRATDRTGTDRIGTDRIGSDRIASDRSGAEGTGSGGPGAGGPSAGGPGSGGPGATPLGPRRTPAPAVDLPDESSFADLDLEFVPPASGGPESSAGEFFQSDFSVSEASLSDGGMLLDSVLLDTDRDRPTLQKTPIGGFRIVDPALLLRDNPGRSQSREVDPARAGRGDERRESGPLGGADLSAELSRDSGAAKRKVVLRLDAEPRNETGPLPLARGPQSAPTSADNSLRQAVRDLADPTRLDAAMVRLRAAGAGAIDTLVGGFPGPLYVDRIQVDPLQVPVRDHGPLLRLLLDLGPLAAEALLPLIDTTDLEVRHYAVFAFTVLDPGSALPRLGTRLFDPDPGVRRVALLAVHHWRTRPEFPTVVQFIGRVVRSGRTGQSKLAIAILARLKALGGAPALLDLLVEDRDGLGEPAHRALVEMTRQDFGYAADQWRTWLDRNAQRPRVELLIDALEHPSRTIRGGALAELRALTGDHLGYAVDAPQADRRAAIDQWWYWWQAEGLNTLGHYR